MVRNIMIVDGSPLIRLKKMMKFIAGSAFIVFHSNTVIKNCAKHLTFDKNYILYQILSANVINT